MYVINLCTNGSCDSLWFKAMANTKKNLSRSFEIFISNQIKNIFWKHIPLVSRIVPKNPPKLYIVTNYHNSISIIHKIKFVKFDSNLFLFKYYFKLNFNKSVEIFFKIFITSSIQLIFWTERTPNHKVNHI